eukprot:CAMPEP_0194285110 /NCGR_PEP_ID=MMETSP0169-20130528/29400_1 /TAXON_ID=218684 /ORGANISM="Corethron pennatum, Strain L29A3" /LENGTH=421 /DNA_ID=CAMNT_0039031145 /DNA_START=64 /DNA_END=1329 /DNA_ORIENTATION=-
MVQRQAFETSAIRKTQTNGLIPDVTLKKTGLRKSNRDIHPTTQGSKRTFKSADSQKGLGRPMSPVRPTSPVRPASPIGMSGLSLRSNSPKKMSNSSVRPCSPNLHKGMPFSSAGSRPNSPTTFSKRAGIHAGKNLRTNVSKSPPERRSDRNVSSAGVVVSKPSMSSMTTTSSVDEIKRSSADFSYQNVSIHCSDPQKDLSYDESANFSLDISTPGVYDQANERNDDLSRNESFIDDAIDHSFIVASDDNSPAKDSKPTYDVMLVQENYDLYEREPGVLDAWADVHTDIGKGLTSINTDLAKTIEDGFVMTSVNKWLEVQETAEICVEDSPAIMKAQSEGMMDMLVGSCIALGFYHSTREALFLDNYRQVDSFSDAQEAVDSDSDVQNSNVMPKDGRKWNRLGLAGLKKVRDRPKSSSAKFR